MKKLTKAQSSGYVSNSVNRDDLLKKFILTHSNKMITDEAKLSYFSEMLLKYRMDIGIKRYIWNLAYDLGYIKNGIEWEKSSKNS